MRFTPQFPLTPGVAYRAEFDAARLPGAGADARRVTSEFAMPALMPAAKAVERIIAGIANGGFELTFPRRFTFAVKFMRLLPYALYFPLMKKMTGAGK